MAVSRAPCAAIFLLLLIPAGGLRRNVDTQQQLDPARCTEVALIEPRNMPQPTTLALESAVGVPGVDLITFVHGDANAQSSTNLVEKSSLLNKAAAQGLLRLLNVHVGDLGGDESRNRMPVFLSEVHGFNGTAGTRYHDEYSRLVMNPGFWNLMKCDRVLLMQSDSLFCRGSKMHLADFAESSYIGGDNPDIRHGTRGHMNGGFSLRSRPAMLKCLDKTQQTSAENQIVQEDIFYSVCHSLPQPPVELMDKFAIDNAMKHPIGVPLGMHKPWGRGEFITENLAACPGANDLFHAVSDYEHGQFQL